MPADGAPTHCSPKEMLVFVFGLRVSQLIMGVYRSFIDEYDKFSFLNLASPGPPCILETPRDAMEIALEETEE